LCVSVYDVNAFVRWDVIGLTISNSKFSYWFTCGDCFALLSRLLLTDCWRNKPRQWLK